MNDNITVDYNFCAVVTCKIESEVNFETKL